MGSFRFPMAALKYLKPEGVLLGPIFPEKCAGLPSTLPAICFSNTLEKKPCPSVVNDDKAVGRLAAEALIAAGYQRLLLVSASPKHHARQREEGARQAAAAQGVPLQVVSLALRTPSGEETYHDIWLETQQPFEEVLRALPALTALPPRGIRPGSTLRA